MLTLQKQGLRVELCEIGEYYQGTRFDHAGVFRRIVQDGYVWADEWFSHQDPFRHDRVCGLSEEFVTVNFEGVPPGELFCKPGVGLLRRPDEEPYDWFRLYEVVNPGEWKWSATACEAVYEHRLPGWYRYCKRILLTGADALQIRHSLSWEAPSPLHGFFYNHHFLTFGGAPVGPERRIVTPWTPAGHWRSEYDAVRFTQDGVAFLGPVDPRNSVYCGDLQNAHGPTSCRFTVKEGAHQVVISGDMPLDHIVLWANPQVACMEPYMPLHLASGESAEWTFRYKFISRRMSAEEAPI